MSIKTNFIFILNFHELSIFKHTHFLNHTLCKINPNFLVYDTAPLRQYPPLDGQPL